MNRYERFFERKISEKRRGLFRFEFEDGKVSAYDFDSEQYRSPIRNSFVKIQGTTGELFNDRVVWLDSNSMVHEGKIKCRKSRVTTDYSNPNLHEFYRIDKIILEYDGIKENLYKNPFGKAKLSEDETAIATLILECAKADSGFQEKNLEDALRDAEMALE